MHLDLTPDQEALQTGTAQLCAGVYPRELLRSLIDGDLDRSRWHKLADAGVFDLRRPEADGGVGLGMAEAALVFQELGRALVPGPLIGTHLAAGAIESTEAGDVIGIAPVEPDDTVYVEHLANLDWLVLLTDDGISVVVGEEARQAAGTTPVRPLDPLTPVSRLAAIPAGSAIGDADQARDWSRDGALLVAAQAAGLAAATCELAAGYAAQRQQFDRPIGSFQAVKHLLADMLTRAELARVAVEAAAVTVDQPGVGDADDAVHSAKVVAGEAAVANGRSCLQIHGGMGFAWEVDAHLYLKRAWVLDQQFGSAAAHCQHIAAAPSKV